MAIAAYFIYSKLVSSAAEATRLFIARRMLVALPMFSKSQLRCAGTYFG